MIFGRSLSSTSFGPTAIVTTIVCLSVEGDFLRNESDRIHHPNGSNDAINRTNRRRSGSCRSSHRTHMELPDARMERNHRNCQRQKPLRKNPSAGRNYRGAGRLYRSRFQRQRQHQIVAQQMVATHGSVLRIFFYYNDETGVTSWELPEYGTGIEEPSVTDGTESSVKQADEHLIATSGGPIKSAPTHKEPRRSHGVGSVSTTFK